MKYNLVIPFIFSSIGLASAMENETKEAESVNASTPNYQIAKTLNLYTDYIFRGMSYARRRGAIQFYVDYTHNNGIYLGTGITNVHKDAIYGNTVEVDVYGGIVKPITEDLIGSIGLFQWIFPQNNKIADQTAFVTELHMVLDYKSFNMKYAYSFTDWFGINTKSFGNTMIGDKMTGSGDTKGTNYIELNYNKPLPFYGLNLNLHVGRTKVKNYSMADYVDYAIGVTKDFTIGADQQWSTGVSYVTTDANDDWYVDAEGYKMGHSKILAFLRHTF